MKTFYSYTIDHNWGMRGNRRCTTYFFRKKLRKQSLEKFLCRVLDVKYKDDLKVQHIIMHTGRWEEHTFSSLSTLKGEEHYVGHGF